MRGGEESLYNLGPMPYPDMCFDINGRRHTASPLANMVPWRMRPSQVRPGCLPPKVAIPIATREPLCARP
jgi:hypothetical protein